MKRPMLIKVRDKHGDEWGFETRADPANMDAWRAAGIEIYEVRARIPGWAVELGIGRPWAAAQMAWQWLRLL